MELDLHIHSNYSFDSYSKIPYILKNAKKKGLSGLAITDHGTIKGGLKALKYPQYGLKVIVGSEIATEVGHVIGLFLTEEIKSVFFIDVLDEIKEQDGIAVLAHPFKKTNEIDKEIIKKIDAIEVFNARTKKHANIMAKEIAKKHAIPITAGSDAHFYFEIGHARTIVNDISDIECIRNAILTNNTKIYGKESFPYVDLFSKSIRIIKTRKLPKRFRIGSRI